MSDPNLVARNILGSAEFAPPRLPVHHPSPLERAVHWIEQQFAAIFHALFAHVHVSSSAAQGIQLVAAFLAICLVLAVVVRLLSGIERTEERQVRLLQTQPQPRPEELYEASLRAADRKAFAEAASLLYRAAVAAIAVRGVVSNSGSATVREIALALRRRDVTLAEKFAQIGEAFTRGAYAQRTVGDAEFGAARDAFDFLHERLRAS